MNTTNYKRWLPTEDAAIHLGCSRAFLDKDRQTRLHDIPFTRLGRHIRYDVADLDAYLERHKTHGGSLVKAESQEG